MDCIPKAIASELCAHVWSGYTAFVKKGQKGHSLGPLLGQPSQVAQAHGDICQSILLVF